MRDLLDELTNWSEQGKRIALATVVETWGSAPRPVGAHMALTSDGEMTGSVSGGCVEGAVLEAGAKALESGLPKLLHFGVADETAWNVGLSCGGNIDVFVRPLDLPAFAILNEALGNEKAAAALVLIRGPENLLGKEIILLENGDAQAHGTFGPDLDPRALDYARDALAEGNSRRIQLQAAPQPVEIFINVAMPSPTLVVVGGVHIAIPLASLAKTLGYYTVVVDPRKMFGSQTRFPHVNQLIQAWPDKALKQVSLTSNTALVMLTHDPKLDDPALKIALNSPAFYIGALGSRKTQAKRRQRLLEAGLTQDQINRIHGPIGLDLGGRSPEEIALAIMAQIVKARNS